MKFLRSHGQHVCTRCRTVFKRRQHFRDFWPGSPVPVNLSGLCSDLLRRRPELSVDRDSNIEIVYVTFLRKTSDGTGCRMSACR